MPPKPPVQTDAPVAVAAANGNVNLTWIVTHQEEEASNPTRYEVWAKHETSAPHNGVMIGSTAGDKQPALELRRCTLRVVSVQSNRPVRCSTWCLMEPPS